jgi:peroxiredoxin
MTKLNIGDKAIGFELPGVDEKEYALTDFAEKNAVAVVFSCNHCPYVQAWEDRMVHIQADYAPRGFQLIAINSNDPQKYPSDSFQAMKQRAAEKKFNFPYLFDETQAVARNYGALRTPEVFLFDQAGNLRYHGAIDDNYDNPSAVKEHYLRDALDALLTDEEPPMNLTSPVGCTIKWK